MMARLLSPPGRSGRVSRYVRLRRDDVADSLRDKQKGRYDTEVDGRSAGCRMIGGTSSNHGQGCCSSFFR